MRELFLCQGVVGIVQQQAGQYGVKRVTGVWLEIGALSCIEESAVRLSFDIVCQGTLVQGCELYIDYKPVQAWCWDCSQAVEITQHDAQCPLCQGNRLRVDAGDSLKVKSIEAEQPIGYYGAESDMRIGVPGQALTVGESIYQPAQVEVCGIKRDVNVALICEDDTVGLVGQWVLVHVGFAISIIDEDEAKATLDTLRRMEYDVISA